MTSEVHKLLKGRDWAFRLGDTALYSTARTELKRGIRTAKRAYKEKKSRTMSQITTQDECGRGCNISLTTRVERRK